ncbi:MAG: transposase [Planctomycetes bacterium]|nr:transposase [Planctomycetota bacterium]
MARRPRADGPDTWHHVVNRAIAKRPYFEARSEKRYFLARLASEVRAGRLEVHAFCLMTTHFHLLVRSPVGELSEAMRRVQCAYSRHFNRRHRRDGPLIRARFYSKRVRTDSYRRAVVRYIDANAVRAGLVRHAAEHEFGSARAYVIGPRPRWLCADWVEGTVAGAAGERTFDAAGYAATFGQRAGEDTEALASLIEARMAAAGEIDALDDLIGATPRQVREWMTRKARLADGMEVGLPVCGPWTLLDAIERRKRERGEWLVERLGRTWRGSQIARYGLLREAAGLSISRIARLEGVTCETVRRRLHLHRWALAEATEYATAVSEIVAEALAAAFPV